MKMYDERIISYRGRPLFQTAKISSPYEAANRLEDVACFFYILKGCIDTIEASGERRSKNQEGLLKSCGNFISRYHPDQDGSDFEAAVIYFYPDVLKEIYRNDLPPFVLNDAKAMPPKKVVGNALIQRFMEGLFVYFENEELMDENLARLKIQELVMILLKSNYFEGVVSFFQGLFAPKSATFRQVVENNRFSNISVDQLAFLCHQSLSSFKRNFKLEFGESPARYLKNEKLKEAAKKLLHTQDSISAIAYDCGFQDPSTFSSLFSERFGLSPRAYRQDQIRK
ncbi:MAG: helix-turn-helix transcriptional regulator [Bacteroidetes bacterium]|nr:helix-turn-helix transcriptional regulator [Bacteroidota bacterium]